VTGTGFGDRLQVPHIWLDFDASARIVAVAAHLDVLVADRGRTEEDSHSGLGAAGADAGPIRMCTTEAVTGAEFGVASCGVEQLGVLLVQVDEWSHRNPHGFDALGDEPQRWGEAVSELFDGGLELLAAERGGLCHDGIVLSVTGRALWNAAGPGLIAGACGCRGVQL
jgi:hypothetical protein